MLFQCAINVKIVGWLVLDDAWRSLDPHRVRTVTKAWGLPSNTIVEVSLRSVVWWVRWTEMCPPNPYAKALTPVSVFGDRTIRGLIRVKGGI